MLIDYFIDWYQCIYYFNGGFELVNIYYICAIISAFVTVGLLYKQFCFQKDQSRINDLQAKLLEEQIKRQKAEDYAINWSFQFKQYANLILDPHYADSQDLYYKECYDDGYFLRMKKYRHIVKTEDDPLLIEFKKNFNVLFFSIMEEPEIKNDRYTQKEFYFYKQIIPISKLDIVRKILDIIYDEENKFNEDNILRGHINFLKNIQGVLNAIKNFNNGLLSFSQANKNRIYTTLKNNDNIRNLMKILSFIISDKDLFDYDKIIACYEKLSEADKDLIKEKCNNILTIINEDSGNIIQSNIWAIYRC